MRYFLIFDICASSRSTFRKPQKKNFLFFVFFNYPNNNPHLLIRLVSGTVVAQVFQELVDQSFCWLAGIWNLFRELAITHQLFVRDMRGSLTPNKSPNASRWPYSFVLQWDGAHINTWPFMQNTTLAINICIKIAIQVEQLSASTSKQSPWPETSNLWYRKKIKVQNVIEIRQGWY